MAELESDLQQALTTSAVAKDACLTTIIGHMQVLENGTHSTAVPALRDSETGRTEGQRPTGPEGNLKKDGKLERCGLCGLCGKRAVTYRQA